MATGLNRWLRSQRNGLERGVFLADTLFVNNLSEYRRHAMKLASVKELGGDEGYVARIPGFRGLLATGVTKKEALSELESALSDWIEVALKRKIGLPALRKKQASSLTAVYAIRPGKFPPPLESLSKGSPRTRRLIVES